MKKVRGKFLLILAGLLLFTQSSEAYMIPDTTLVKQSNNGNWVDRIGGPTFEIYGINYSLSGDNLNFSIYTNYPKTGHQVGAWNTFPGDFGLDVNRDGTYEYGLAVKNHDSFIAGTLYNVKSWYDSAHYRPSAGYIYGLSQVTIESGESAGTGNVSWTTIGSYPDTVPVYRIDIRVDNINNLAGYDGNIGIHWAAATCANDIITEANCEPVPEPSTWFLIGSGLFSLMIFGIKKKKLRLIIQ